MGLDLRDLRKPLEPVIFPNGATHQPVPFGPNEYQLWRELRNESDPLEAGRMGIQIIRACYPTVTDDDLLDCDGDMALALAAYPGGKIEQVRTALKNAVAVVRPTPEAPPPSDTMPSSPKPNGNTSSHSTRKRSAKTRGASPTANPTDSQNSSGTGTTTLKNPDESTPFAVKWSTSTAPASPATL